MHNLHLISQPYGTTIHNTKQKHTSTYIPAPPPVGINLTHSIRNTPITTIKPYLEIKPPYSENYQTANLHF
jgi:hypothetical protein